MCRGTFRHHIRPQNNVCRSFQHGKAQFHSGGINIFLYSRTDPISDLSGDPPRQVTLFRLFHFFHVMKYHVIKFHGFAPFYPV